MSLSGHVGVLWRILLYWLGGLKAVRKTANKWDEQNPPLSLWFLQYYQVQPTIAPPYTSLPVPGLWAQGLPETLIPTTDLIHSVLFEDSRQRKEETVLAIERNRSELPDVPQDVGYSQHEWTITEGGPEEIFEPFILWFVISIGHWWVWTLSWK